MAIALPVGIALLNRDGSAMPHPDPVAEHGVVTAFARTRDKLYALRWRDQFMASEVVEVSQSNVRVLYTDSQHWNDIGVADTSFVLMRFGSDAVDELRLSFAGEALQETRAPLPDAIAVSVRVLGDVAYYAARFDDHSVLGRIEQGAWLPVLQAGNTLAGPLGLADGTALVALDGVLATFANEVATPLTEPDFVSGLYQLDDHTYATTRTGLRNLSSAGLGAQLFDMSEMVAPDECSLSTDARSECELEWQHVLVELLGANIPVSVDAAQQKACAVATAAGSGGVIAAAGTGGVTSTAVMKDNAGAAAPPAVVSRSNVEVSGCTCSTASRHRPVASKLVFFVLALCLIRLASRRLGHE